MDFIVNAITRDLVAYATPLVLMHTPDAMSFVTSATALAFLPTIDDVSDAKDLLLTWEATSNEPEATPEATQKTTDPDAGTARDAGSR